MPELNKNEFNDKLDDYVKRYMKALTSNPISDWHEIYESFEKRPTNKGISKSKREICSKAIGEIFNLRPFIKFSQKFKKVLENPDEYREGDKYNFFLSIDESLKKIEDEIKKNKTEQ